MNKAIDVSLKKNNFIVLSSLYERLIDCYITKNDYDKALAINEKLLKLDPNEVQYYLTKFYIYRHSKGVEYANKYLAKLKEKFPNNEKVNKFNDKFNNTSK